MEYTNRLKGSVTQALVRSLLTNAGITIVPLGIEEVIREIAELRHAEYRALNLPDSLKQLPDFFAVNQDRTQSWLIEVKFRRIWSDEVKAELEAKLKKQVKSWSPIYLILFFGETPSKYYPNTPASWVRAGQLIIVEDELHVRIGRTIKPWNDIEWNDFPRIQDIFPQLNTREKWEEEVISATLEISKGLVSL